MSKCDSGKFKNTKGALVNQEKIEIKIPDIEIQKKEFQKAIDKVSEVYKLDSNGYFGEKGSGALNRVIRCKNQYEEAEKFYQLIRNNHEEIVYNNNLRVVSFTDENRISYRIMTKTGNSPAIQIEVEKDHRVKRQKIHFIREE